MRNGALITQFPGVTWFVDCTIPGISEILVARRHHAERSIGALICPTTGGKFLSPANPLAIRMLGQFLSVEIQAREEKFARPSWGGPDVTVDRFSGLLAQFEPDGMSGFPLADRGANIDTYRFETLFGAG